MNTNAYSFAGVTFSEMDFRFGWWTHTEHLDIKQGKWCDVMCCAVLKQYKWYPERITDVCQTIFDSSQTIILYKNCTRATQNQIWRCVRDAMHSHVHHTHASRTCFSAIIQLFFYMKLFLLQQGALTTDVADDFPHLFAAANLSILTVFA